jgi:hypothetical protein
VELSGELAMTKLLILLTVGTVVSAHDTPRCESTQRPIQCNNPSA